MDVGLFRNERIGTDWLAVGKYPLCFACITRRPKLQGLPVDAFGLLKEGEALSPGGGTVALMNRSPHPNAAKVFVNWFLSREGQITFQRAGQIPGDSSYNSLREDIPKKVIRPDRLRVKEVKYQPTDRWDVLDLQPIFNIINEGLKQAGKRK